MRPRILAKKLLLLFVASAVSLCLCEAILELSGVWICRHSDHMFLVIDRDETLGWRMQRDFRSNLDMFDVEHIAVASNSDGFWDKPFVLQPPEGRTRVAFVGDSYTWGYGVHDQERFTSILDRGNAALETMNFGIPAFGTDQALLAFREVAAKYRPAIVVLTIVENDFEDNMCCVRWGRPKPYFDLADDGRLELRNLPLPATDYRDDGVLDRIAPPYSRYFGDAVHKRSRTLDWIVKHSDVARLCYTALGSLRRRDPAPPPRVRITKEAASAADLKQVDLLTALVRELSRSATENGARLLVVMASDHALYGLVNARLVDAGIRVVDLTTDSLAKQMKIAPADVYFRFNPHWRPATHAFVAALLEKELTRMVAESAREK